jgi:hypothetical protein
MEDIDQQKELIEAEGEDIHMEDLQAVITIEKEVVKIVILEIKDHQEQGILK